MSNASSESCSCGGKSGGGVVPFRLPMMLWGSVQVTTCPADGFLVFVPDGPAAGAYLTMGGKFHRLVTEELMCGLLGGAVQQLIEGD